jgi:hypothetical protein
MQESSCNLENLVTVWEAELQKSIPSLRKKVGRICVILTDVAYNPDPSEKMYACPT